MADTKTCSRCGATWPADRYHFKPRRGLLTGVCRQCVRDDARRSHRAKRIAEVAALPPYVAPTERKCRVCGVTKPLTREFFDHRSECVAGFCHRCVVCRRADQRTRYHASEEERLRRLTNERISRRMRDMDEGRETYCFRSAEAAYREAMGVVAQQEAHPTEPLALWFDEVRRIDGREEVELAEAFGVPARRLYGIGRREFDRVSLSTADKMVWGYDKAVRLRAEAIEESLRERWQAAPGNGERLLRYLDEAERLAYLAGLVVERVEDLWPEMAS